ncbi:MAG: type II secretion system F family protein [Legionellaceae bacterium]|nr:type II secretion system F family protein [Legionellaceae bacterium]
MRQYSYSSISIKMRDVSIFTRQLKTMIEAGVPLIQSFEMIAQGLPSMSAILQTIILDLEQGTTLAASFKKHPRYFNDLYCHLIAAGEASGTLVSMLEKIAQYTERTQRLRKKIKKALTYPMIVLTLTGLMLSLLCIFVIPQFELLFKEFGAELPAFTRLIIDVSSILQHDWYFIGLGLCGMGTIFYYIQRHFAALKHHRDSFLLKLPLLDAIIKKAIIARFSRTLAITLAAGLPLVEALSFVAKASANSAYEQAIEKIRIDIISGKKLHLTLQRSSLFFPLMIQMVAVGEEAGALEPMLSKVADYYEDEIDHRIEVLTTFLEPLVMAILGLLIGAIVIAMYLPIFKIGSAL